MQIAVLFVVLRCVSTALIQLTPGQAAQPLDQREAIQFFQLASALPNQYLLLEIEIRSAPAQVALGASLNSPPATIEDATYLDEMSWQLNKSSQFLQLPIGANPWFATVFNFAKVNQSISYSVFLTQSESPLCSQNCRNHGTCVSGVCQCIGSFIGDDCGFLTFNMIDTSFTVRLPPLAWRFLLMNFDTNSTSLDISPLTIPSEVLLYILCRGDAQVLVPSAYAYNASETFQNGETASYSVYVKCKQPIASLYNAAADAWANVTFSTGSGGGGSMDMTYVYIIAGVFVPAVLCWAVVAYFKCRRRIPNEAVPVESSIERIPPHIIQALYPISKFQSVSTLKQSDCPICLEPFNPTSDVRSLPCNHVYHGSCIDLWFTSHTVSITQVCCMCKQNCSINRGILEEIDTTAVDALAVDMQQTES